MGTATVAIVIASLSLLWHVASFVWDRRRMVKVSVVPEPVPLDQRKLELTVVVRNLGRNEESVERIGIEFVDETEEGGLGQSSASEQLDRSLRPHHNVRWTWDLGEQRYRVGRKYRGFAVLGSGKVIRTKPEHFESAGLLIAGLVDSVLPRPSDDEIRRAQARLFPSESQQRREEPADPV